MTIPHRRVGLRELKNRLSQYVRVVRAGGHVQVTDRGQVVAELLPPAVVAADGQHPGLSALKRRGLLRPGGRNAVELYPRIRRSPKAGRAKRVLEAVRADR